KLLPRVRTKSTRIDLPFSVQSTRSWDSERCPSSPNRLGNCCLDVSSTVPQLIATWPACAFGCLGPLPVAQHSLVLRHPDPGLGVDDSEDQRARAHCVLGQSRQPQAPEETA